MSADDNLIGTITRVSAYGQFRAKCASCSWSLQKPTRKEAEDSLRTHDSLSHPQPIRIYRDGGGE